MESVFLWVLNRSLTAVWLILAVLVLRLCLRRAPRWIACALWIPVGLRLVCPLSFESVLSLLPSGQPLPQEILSAATPTIQSGIAAVDDRINPILADSLSPNLGDSVNPSQVLGFIAANLWVVGMVVMILYALVSALCLRHRVRTAIHQQDGTWLCDSVTSPFILGVFRPRIYLPATLDPTHKQAVLAHEQAHLRRWDHRWKPLGFAILAIHWFNPLVWVAYSCLCRDMETACDQRVIRDMDADGRKAYSAALLACSAPSRSVVGCPLSFGELDVKKRIKAVLHYKKPALWLIIAAVTVSAAITACLLTDPLTAVGVPSAPSVTVSHTHSEMHTSIRITEWNEHSFSVAWTNGNDFDITTGEIYHIYKENEKGTFDKLDKELVFHLVGRIIPAKEEWMWLDYDLQGLTLKEGVTYRLEFPFHIDEKHLDIDAEEDQDSTEEFTNYIDFQVATDRSDIFDDKDIADAKRIVEKHFDRHFDGCTLLKLWYDESYSLGRADEWAIQYKADQAIVLLSDFKTGNHTTSLNPNDTYRKWNWILVRDKGGKWELKDWGYG